MRVGVERVVIAADLELCTALASISADEACRVRAAQRLGVDQRRIPEVQRHVQAGGAQVVGDGVEPRAALRVAPTHIVQTALGVGEDERGHSGPLGFSVKVPRMADNNDVTRQIAALVDQISTIIVGKRPQIEDCVACLLAGGHLLIEDVPGVGKTTLAHALAVSLGLKFSRVQFTADLMPSDLVGRQRLRAQQGGLRVPPGPGVRAGAAGRRDQPRRPEDAERAARSDGRAPGDGRKRNPRAAKAVLRDRHAEPGGPARHLPAARVAARPFPDVHHAGLPRSRLRARTAGWRGPARLPSSGCNR